MTFSNENKYVYPQMVYLKYIWKTFGKYLKNYFDTNEIVKKCLTFLVEMRNLL